MASALTKGLRMPNRIWILCFVLSLYVQVLAASKPSSAQEAPCSSVTLEKLKSSPCDLASQDVQVAYRNRKLQCGAVELKNGVADEPKFLYAGADKDKAYTLIMVDPDAPGHEDVYYRHWLVADIAGEDLAAGILKNGRVLTEYTAPTPPKGTGLHRYQFFILQQSPDQAVDSPAKAKAKFDVVAYGEDNALCGPVTAFEFRTKF